MIEKMGMSDYVNRTNSSTFRGPTTACIPRKSPRARSRYLPHGRAFQGRR